MHTTFLVVITVSPFRFVWSGQEASVSWYWSISDAFGNAVLFAPLGLVLVAKGWPWHKIVGFGLALSVAIECVQLFTPRTSSVIDVGLNTMGIALVALWSPRRSLPFARALIFTVPLWSLGLLWPAVTTWPAVIAASALVAGATVLLADDRQRPYVFDQAWWISVSMAPMISNDWPSAIVVVVAGGLAGLAVSSRDYSSMSVVAWLTCIGAALSLLFAGLPLGLPLDTWSVHAATLLLALLIGPLVLSNSINPLLSRLDRH